MFSAKQLLACAERELKMRLQVYPGRIEAGKMTLAKAQFEIDAMRAIAEHFRKLAVAEEPQGGLPL